MNNFRWLTLLILSSLFFSAQLRAEPLTPDVYVQMDLQARQITLEGVRKRSDLLAKGASLEAQMKASDATRQAVDAVYQTQGTNSGQALAWYRQNAEQVLDWLAKNPDLSEEYEQIATELDVLSKQLQNRQSSQE